MVVCFSTRAAADTLWTISHTSCYICMANSVLHISTVRQSTYRLIWTFAVHICSIRNWWLEFFTYPMLGARCWWLEFFTYPMLGARCWWLEFFTYPMLGARCWWLEFFTYPMFGARCWWLEFFTYPMLGARCFMCKNSNHQCRYLSRLHDRSTLYRVDTKTGLYRKAETCSAESQG